MKTALFATFALFTAAFVVFWIAEERRSGRKHRRPGLLDNAIGLVTQFLDTLGIGSFATMSAAFKFWRTVPDEHIPGTLNVGVTIPGMLEAFIYVAVVDVDVTTLALMIAASVVGAWLGAGVVSRWPRRRIQIGMGIALLTTAALSLLAQLHLLPGGGTLLGLTGAKLAVGVVANALFGALMTLGIGLFAPCMMVTYWLGMSPRAVFPIMIDRPARAGGQRSLHPARQLQPAGRARHHAGRHSRSPCGGVPGAVDPARRAALARHRGGGLHGGHDAALGGGRATRRELSNRASYRCLK